MYLKYNGLLGRNATYFGKQVLTFQMSVVPKSSEGSTMVPHNFCTHLPNCMELHPKRPNFDSHCHFNIKSQGKLLTWVFITHAPILWMNRENIVLQIVDKKNR